MPLETFQHFNDLISDIIQKENILEKSLHLETFQFFNGFIFDNASHPLNMDSKVSDFEVSKYSKALISDILLLLNIPEKSVTFSVFKYFSSSIL